jgi:single-stranded-DNA-specific exonuclease
MAGLTYLPFVLGVLQRPQTTPLLIPGTDGPVSISSDELNTFCGLRRPSLSAPRISVATCRALWAMSQGELILKYLPSTHPRLLLQNKPGQLSIVSGRPLATAEVETILFEPDQGEVNSAGLLLQSPTTTALFAALNLYDRRRGFDFAPAYLAFLKAKEAHASAQTIKETLLAAADEMLLTLQYDYQTDRNPPLIAWHQAPKSPDFESTWRSPKLLDLGRLVTEADLLETHREEAIYQPRKPVSFRLPERLMADRDPREPFEESDHAGMWESPTDPLNEEESTTAANEEMESQTSPASAAEISTVLGISAGAADFLVTRGFASTDQASEHLQVTKLVSHDPYLMKGMFEVAGRLWTAITTGEKIVLYGDYDADGIPGTALLSLYLRSVGAKVFSFIPDRGEGYGLSLAAAKRLAEQFEPDLVVTIDCGSSDHEAIAWLQSAQSDLWTPKDPCEVIVIDHHLTTKGLPPTPYLVNPNRSDGDPYPFHGLCGAGVAYKVVQALATPASGGLYGEIPELYDLLIMATVGDQVPLTDENRYYVQAGLAQINNQSRANLGLWAITAEAGIFLEKLSADELAWMIAPRINAVGRMALNPNDVVELLTTSDHDRAFELARSLDKANTEQQNFTNKLFDQALEQLGRTPPDEVLGIYLAESTVGVASLVAAKVAERYQRPTLIINAAGAGAGRAPAGQDIITHLETLASLGIFDARENGQVRPHFSGSKGTCDFKDLEVEDFLAAVKLLRQPRAGRPRRQIDGTLLLSEVTLTLAEEMRKLGPYGEGNPEPSFLLQNLEIREPHYSKSGHSLLFFVADGEHEIRCHCFEGGQYPIRELPARIDILANPIIERSGEVGLAVAYLKPSKRQPEEKTVSPIDAKQIVFIVGASPRSGKTEASRIVARLLDTPAIGTSDVINEMLEKDLDLAPGTIRADRDQNPDKWRPELVAKGNWMADNGLTAGILGLQRGYRVIEGVRRASELKEAIGYARTISGLRPMVLCLIDPGASARVNDNTEGESLIALSDRLIENTPMSPSADQAVKIRSLAKLEKTIRTALDELSQIES